MISNRDGIDVDVKQSEYYDSLSKKSVANKHFCKTNFLFFLHENNLYF